MKAKYFLLLMLGLMTFINLAGYYKKSTEPKYHKHQDYSQTQPVEPPYEPPEEIKPEISTTIPTRELTYDEVNLMLNQWHKDAPEITELGVVGNSHRNRPIPYIRIGKKSGPKVLITAAIHGNEKLCAMTMLGVFNRILKNYMDDNKVTTLLKERDIYFIPIVSPEGYIRNSRYTLNLDPNRNFNGRNLSPKSSIPCVDALKKFHEKHRFNAVMSCHNYGEIFFYPWGYTRRGTQIDGEYRSLLSKMGELSGYRHVRLHGRSAPPYYGYEIDWFHKHGACAIVNEVGTRFGARRDEIERETTNNYEATLLFIKEAPLIRQ